MALSAELHLVDQRLDEAATSLKKVAEHPETPAHQRERCGLLGADLLEKLHRPREAVEMLQVLEEHGFRAVRPWPARLGPTPVREIGGGIQCFLATQ